MHYGYGLSLVMAPTRVVTVCPHTETDISHTRYTVELKSSFPKGDKRQSKNRGCDASVKFRGHVFGKGALHEYVHMYACIHMWTVFLLQNSIYELGICIASTVFGMALIGFCKRTLQLDKSFSIYIHVVILYTCTYLWWCVVGVTE